MRHRLMSRYHCLHFHGLSAFQACESDNKLNCYKLHRVPSSPVNPQVLASWSSSSNYQMIKR
jgi:hypothetical protein